MPFPALAALHTFRDGPFAHYPLTPIGAIGVGVLLLFLGRKLFWLFVAAAGFLAGAQIAAALFPQQPGFELIGGAVLGVVGALLAVFVQKIAIGVGGFLAGGYFVMTLLDAWAPQAPAYGWIAFLIGGLVGAALMALVFDWALIIFSYIGGAHLITQTVSLSQSTNSITFVVLVVIGVVVQARLRASGKAA